MKYLLILSCLMFSSGMYAQVGISTPSPQKALHISGVVNTAPIPGTSINVVNPTLRIDGLSNINQGLSGNLHPVSVTDKGDLVVSSLVKPLLMIDPINPENTEKDYIPSEIIINQTSASTTTNAVVRSFTFTLTTPSLVKFSAITSFKFSKASDGTPITDGSNRTWGTRFRFSAAPTEVSTAANAYFGESIRSYSNATNNTAGTGVFYTSSDETIFLPQGQYTLEISIFAATNASQTPLRITYGSGNDTMSIIAYPIQ